MFTKLEQRFWAKIEVAVPLWHEVIVHKNVFRDCVKHVAMQRCQISQWHDGFLESWDAVQDNFRTGRPHVENNTVQFLTSLLDADRRWTARVVTTKIGVCDKILFHILHDILG